MDAPSWKHATFDLGRPVFATCIACGAHMPAPGGRPGDVVRCRCGGDATVVEPPDPIAAAGPGGTASLEPRPDPTRPASGEMRAGARLVAGRYALEQAIGQGEGTAVWAARDQASGRTVALKTIRGTDARPLDETALRRLGEAATTSIALVHENIVPVLDHGHDGDGGYFITMALVGGPPLDRILSGAPGGRLAPARAAEIARDVASALAHAHALGVLHGDLKPSNILIDGSGTPRVTDFGLDRATELEPGWQSVTKSAVILGTPGYMAPEKAVPEQEPASEKADVFSLGAILYECLTGRRPFGAGTPLQVLERLMSSDPPRPRAIERSVPEDLEAICLQCLARDPAWRFGDAASLERALARVAIGGSGSRHLPAARPVSTPASIGTDPLALTEEAEAAPGPRPGSGGRILAYTDPFARTHADAPRPPSGATNLAERETLDLPPGATPFGLAAAQPVGPFTPPPPDSRRLLGGPGGPGAFASPPTPFAGARPYTPPPWDPPEPTERMGAAPRWGARSDDHPEPVRRGGPRPLHFVLAGLVAFGSSAAGVILLWSSATGEPTADPLASRTPAPGPEPTPAPAPTPTPTTGPDETDPETGPPPVAPEPRGEDGLPARALEAIAALQDAWAMRGDARLDPAAFRGRLRTAREMLDRAIAEHPEMPLLLAWRAESRRRGLDLRRAVADLRSALIRDGTPALWRQLGLTLLEQAALGFDARAALVCAGGAPDPEALRAAGDAFERAHAARPPGDDDPAARRVPWEGEVKTRVLALAERVARGETVSVEAATAAATGGAPDDLVLALRLAAISRGAQDRAGALAALARALEAAPNDPQALVDRARHLQLSGDAVGAVADHDRALAIAPDGQPVLVLRGLAQMAAGRGSAARADLDRAILADDACPAAWGARACARILFGDAPGAIADLDRMLALMPDSVPGRVLRAEARREIGGPAEQAAMADDTRAVQIAPGEALGYVSRALTHFRSGRTDAALADVDAAEARGARAWLGDARGRTACQAVLARHGEPLAHLYILRGRRALATDASEALRDYDLAVALDPRSTIARINRAYLLRTTDPGRAREDLDAVIALGDDPDAYSLRGQVRATLGDPLGGLEDHDKAIELRPGDARLLLSRGLARRMAGKPRDAIADYDAALQIEPGLAEALYDRANCWYGLGEYNRADTDYRAVLKIAPQAAFASQARVMIEKIGERRTR